MSQPTTGRVQAVFAQEEGDRKGNAHIQAAATMMFARYDNANKDFAALLRLLCGFKPATHHKWAVTITIHPAEEAEQASLRKVNKAGLFGYCLKQRFTSSIFKCAVPVLQTLDTIWSFALMCQLMHVSSQPLLLTLSQPEELCCNVWTALLVLQMP